MSNVSSDKLCMTIVIVSIATIGHNTALTRKTIHLTLMVYHKTDYK